MIVAFTLEPTPPFRLDLTAWALRRRALNRVTTWDGSSLARLLPGSPPIRVEVRQQADKLLVRAEAELPTDRLAARAETAVRAMLGIDQDLRAFQRAASADPVLGPYVERFRGWRPPRYPSVFEALLNAVACQQVSLEVGITLLGRLAETFGGGPPGPLRLPSPAELVLAEPEAIRALGFSRNKARCIVGLARAFVSGELDEATLAAAPDDELDASLRSQFGVGRWTCDYVRLRGLARFDVFPTGDSGARNGVAKAIARSRAERRVAATAHKANVQPNDTSSSDTQAADVRRSGARPSGARPTTAQPTTARPTTARPTTAQSTDVQPSDVDAAIERWRPFGGLAYLTLLLAGLEASGVFSVGAEAS